MRRIALILLMLPIAALAQIKFGYLNYSEAKQKVPQYQQTQELYNELLKRCEQELLRNEEELTRNYVAFLDGQRDFPEPILRKRQKELQDHVDRSVRFREEVKKWLVQAHDSLFAPVNAVVDDAIARVCMHNGLAYVINLEEAGYLFVNPAMGFDITKAVVNTILKNGEPQIVQATDSNMFVIENNSIINDSVATDSKKEAEAENKEEVGKNEAGEGSFH